MDNGLTGSSLSLSVYVQCACLSVSPNQQDLRSVHFMVMEYGFVLFCFPLCLPLSLLDFWDRLVVSFHGGLELERALNCIFECERKRAAIGFLLFFFALFFSSFSSY